MPLKTHQDDMPAINLTPMIDIVFNLIIFFMVSTRFTEIERKVDLSVPQVGGASGLSEVQRTRTRPGPLHFAQAARAADLRHGEIYLPLDLRKPRADHEEDDQVEDDIDHRRQIDRRHIVLVRLQRHGGGFRVQGSALLPHAALRFMTRPSASPAMSSTSSCPSASISVINRSTLPTKNR